MIQETFLRLKSIIRRALMRRGLTPEWRLSAGDVDWLRERGVSVAPWLSESDPLPVVAAGILPRDWFGPVIRETGDVLTLMFWDEWRFEPTEEEATPFWLSMTKETATKILVLGELP